MNSLHKIVGGVQRLLESNTDEVIVFLVIFLFIFLGRTGNRDNLEVEEYERSEDSGTLVFIIVFAIVLILGGIVDDNY